MGNPVPNNPSYTSFFELPDAATDIISAGSFWMDMFGQNNLHSLFFGPIFFFGRLWTLLCGHPGLRLSVFVRSPDHLATLTLL